MENTAIIFENNFTALHLRIADGVLYNDGVEDKQSGYCFKKDGSRLPLFAIPGFDMSDADMQITESVDNRDGLSADAHVMNILFTDCDRKARLELRTYENNPFIRVSFALEGRFGKQIAAQSRSEASGIETAQKADSREIDTLFNCPTDQKHFKVKTVVLRDITDENNILVEETNTTVYPHIPFTVKGQLFVIDAYLQNQAMMIAKEAPSFAGRVADSEYDVCVNFAKSISVAGIGADLTKESDYTFDTPLFALSFAAGKKETLERAWRDYYRLDMKNTLAGGIISTSNTWGDRNQDAAVCEGFMLGEIECGKKLGVNAVQIDDGWQKGKSANSKLAKSKLWGAGYYNSDPDYWSVDAKKFPNGLAPIAKATQDAGIKLGLWFSPDFANYYENWQKDAETLLDLHKKYSVAFFKIDGVKLEDKLTETRLAAMVDRVHRESGGKVSFNFDITAQRRWGYLYKRELGNLFVENRYTDFVNYFPHSTLRSVWMLSRYIPTAKLQMEFLNLRRCADKYGDDPLAPNNYGIDYAFATVMFACPLYWMEMSNLSDEDSKVLAHIASVRNKIAPDLSFADVTPVGDQPDGTAFTGFRADCGSFGYLMLFRENSQEDSFYFDIPELAGKKLVKLAGEGETVVCKSGIKFTAQSPRSYLLLKYED
ncbi:MAG: alpha-galactosidase [Clostridia bacterium]|nr:alpha-galactosidase [Clostridia bacterium]